ncbi:hypothetical protein D9619_010452 [Psilocybe cf. subviscida]|uniref:MARVEL domain-containing protein n=1 Tax=Psilocybe cf. subviscida TaxID=2480587 RepID=A0A8H5ERZ4_9AGAR|nr:hypothetical protein D9619_010452 [Psilocybe cf. subviscida]
MLSSIGKKKVAGHAVFLLTDIIVLALSATVNQFQDFFYIADLFPFALSIISLVIVVILLALDLGLPSANLPCSRAPADIAIFGVLSVFWMSFNAFSTARWREIPFQCDAIPTGFLDERLWCKSLQALKSFVWINFLACLGISLFTLRYTVAQYYRGHRHILATPLSRYRPDRPSGAEVTTESWTQFNASGRSRGSEFLQFEKVTNF